MGDVGSNPVETHISFYRLSLTNKLNLIDQFRPRVYLEDWERNVGRTDLLPCYLIYVTILTRWLYPSSGTWYMVGTCVRGLVRVELGPPPVYHVFKNRLRRKFDRSTEAWRFKLRNQT